MVDVLPEETRRLVALAGPEPDATQRAMADHADDESFPTVGPSVGGLLTVLARLTGAEHVFEFGSGFGYSAAWFARGMAEGGEVVLTEVDEDELELARSFLADGGYAPGFSYELGDAVEVVDRLDGPFDAVLLDHEKWRYVEGFEAVRDKVAPGGAVVADNVLRARHDPDDILDGFEDEPADDASIEGVVRYLERVRADPAFVTVVLPLGNGVSLSVRHS